MSGMDKTIEPPPFRVGLLLIDGFALMSYASVVEPLRAANLLARRPLYELRHIPGVGETATSSVGARVPGQGRVGEPPAFDLLLVLAGGDPAAFHEPRIFAWLRRAGRLGVPLGGVSGGPVILARAGLMERRRMTVHWDHAPALAEISPSLMIERSLYVIDRDRVTCAGGTAPMDLMHALIARHHGTLFARQVSDWFLHTDIRPSGGPQRAGLVERHGTTNPALLDAIEAMETHIADPLDLGQLARVAGVESAPAQPAFPRQARREHDGLLPQSATGKGPRPPARVLPADDRDRARHRLCRFGAFRRRPFPALRRAALHLAQMILRRRAIRP